jgi:2,4-dienoyl-CoA reductase-like NADH-dependent reductase (Old Yellow Enzyme family)
MNNKDHNALFQPLELPCGTVLKNRIVKSAMSDSLGNGRGNPTHAQIRLYERWASAGVAAMIVGEVQGSPARVPPMERNSGFSWVMQVLWRILQLAPRKDQAQSIYPD